MKLRNGSQGAAGPRPRDPDAVLHRPPERREGGGSPRLVLLLDMYY